VEERRDLHAFVLAFLGHSVRERAENVFAILEFLVCLLERFATEEHLPSKDKWEDEYRDDPPLHLFEVEYFRKDETKDRKAQVADYEFAKSSNPQLSDYTNWISFVMQTRHDRNDAKVNDVVHDGGQQSGDNQSERRIVKSH